jgi:hypothetical protein
MRMILASLLFAAACSSAYAERVAMPMPPGPRTALAIAPAKIRAPYDVQIIRENGETLPTYSLKDRFYVQGNLNERYVIRVTNPTPRRVEAVVTVDGLDVIDGETGSLDKRGYIVAPYGEARIEGFRTSLQDVATFRFSSVDGSYAGRQGRPRNVGVIAVAIFEEQAPPPEQQQVIVGERERPAKDKYDYRDDLDAGAARRGGAGGVATADRARKASPPPPPTAPSAEASGRVAATPPAARPMPRHEAFEEEEGGGAGADYEPAPQPHATHRPGLGTEFGESRSSAASFTRFVRAANRPVAIAELRYNDAAGLMALGIPVAPLPDAGEIMTRETADPFPGSFARAPR